MTKFQYYLTFFLMMVSSFLFVEMAWIGAKFLMEGSVVHTTLDHFIALCGAWYIARDAMSIRLKLDAERNRRNNNRRTQQ